MNTKLLSVAAFSFIALFATGCSFGSADSESSEASSADVTEAVAVTSGSFRLFTEAGHEVDPQCDVFTRLDLTADGVARLSEDLEGRCGTTTLDDANERKYALRLVDESCGAKTYEGTSFARIGGDAARTVTITDYRSLTCKIAVPSQIVVEESDPVHESVSTLYSLDSTVSER